jgi:hypothetical protein
MTTRLTHTALGAVLIALAVAIGACQNSLGGFSGAVGNTPPTNPEESFRVLGNPGTAFTATISDTRQSWTVQGAIPMSIVIVNNSPPVRLLATKLANDNTLLSLNIISGVKLLSYASTTQPFGTAAVQTGAQLKEFAPRANPDVRIAVTGPAGELFQGLVEDRNTGFQVQQRAPAIILFDSPNGSVNAIFFQQQNFGSFDINLTFNGGVVAHATGGPTVTIKQP